MANTFSLVNAYFDFLAALKTGLLKFASLAL